MGISFATDGKDLITFLYYVFSFLLQFSAFAVGTIYFRNSDNRQRRRDERRREEEQRQQRLLEWRKLSQELNLSYFDMKRDQVIPRLQHAKESSKERISLHINGLDVLRYMVNDEYRFPSIKETEVDRSGTEHRSVTTAVGMLRDDLRIVFVILNYCWSLCLLGEIPEIFEEEMQPIVIELANLALPFFSDKSNEHRFTIIKKCLEKFVNHPEIPTQTDTKKLTDKIPYVEFLKYEPNGKPGKMFTYTGDQRISNESFFNTLNFALVKSSCGDNYALRFARKLKAKKNDWIPVGATEKQMVLQLIHDVRFIAWKTENGSLNREEEELCNALKAVEESERLSLVLPQTKIVEMYITRFEQDLCQFKEDGYRNVPGLKRILNRLYDDLKKLKIAEFASGK